MRSWPLGLLKLPAGGWHPTSSLIDRDGRRTGVPVPRGMARRIGIHIRTSPKRAIRISATAGTMQKIRQSSHVPVFHGPRWHQGRRGGRRFPIFVIVIQHGAWTSRGRLGRINTGEPSVWKASRYLIPQVNFPSHVHSFLSSSIHSLTLSSSLCEAGTLLEQSTT